MADAIVNIPGIGPAPVEYKMAPAYVRRTMLRCRGCLSVLAVPTSDRPADGWPSIRCAVCEGAMEWMGEVHNANLVRTEMRTPCDSRCTNARGPKCDCACNSANHGSGLVVAVEVVLGKAPRVTPVDAEKARKRLREYEEARARAKAAVEDVWGAVRRKKAAGVYLSPADFDAYRRSEYASADIVAVGALKTMKGRIDALADIERRVRAYAGARA